MQQVFTIATLYVDGENGQPKVHIEPEEVTSFEVSELYGACLRVNLSYREVSPLRDNPRFQMRVLSESGELVEGFTFDPSNLDVEPQLDEYAGSFDFEIDAEFLASMPAPIALHYLIELRAELWGCDWNESWSEKRALLVDPVTSTMPVSIHAAHGCRLGIQVGTIGRTEWPADYQIFADITNYGPTVVEISTALKERFAGAGDVPLPCATDVDLIHSGALQRYVWRIAHDPSWSTNAVPFWTMTGPYAWSSVYEFSAKVDYEGGATTLVSPIGGTASTDVSIVVPLLKQYAGIYAGNYQLQYFYHTALATAFGVAGALASALGPGGWVVAAICAAGAAGALLLAQAEYAVASSLVYGPAGALDPMRFDPDYRERAELEPAPELALPPTTPAPMRDLTRLTHEIGAAARVVRVTTERYLSAAREGKQRLAAEQRRHAMQLRDRMDTLLIELDMARIRSAEAIERYRFDQLDAEVIAKAQDELRAHGLSEELRTRLRDTGLRDDDIEVAATHAIEIEPQVADMSANIRDLFQASATTYAQALSDLRLIEHVNELRGNDRLRALVEAGILDEQEFDRQRNREDHEASYRLVELRSITPDLARRLTRNGIITTEDLWRLCTTEEGVVRLARLTGLGRYRLASIARRAELMSVDGIGEDIARELVEVGLATLEDLRNADSDKLAARLARRPRTRGRKRHNRDDVRRWVEASQRSSPLGSQTNRDDRLMRA